MMQQEVPLTKEADILCFRHARSQFNEAEESFYQKDPHKNYQHFQSQPDFASQVLYNPKYIDAPLTPFGVKQCEKSRDNALLKNVDVVLVSPLRRALQTANIVFGGMEVPIVVRPELVQSFRYSCDVSSPMDTKQKQFPKIDFQHVAGFGQHWEITKILSKRNLQTFDKFMLKHKNTPFAEQQRLICGMIGSKQIIETDEDLRARANTIKDMLKGYRQKYQTVAIVSHWWVITFLLGEGYDHTSFPLASPNIINAKPYWTSLTKLLRYR